MTTRIKFINRSMNYNLPQIFITAENGMSAIDTITDGIAWRVIKGIGCGSVSQFNFNSSFSIRASWDKGKSLTKTLPAQFEGQYAVMQNSTGIILEKVGNAATQGCIELINHIHEDNGVLAQLYNDGKLIMGKKNVGYKQSALFKPSQKLYWGLASEIKEGKSLTSKSAVLNTNSLFELDLSGVSDVLVSLNGNAKEGYYFQVEEQR
ncbi:hypothetical protein [Pseudoalteromonas umbrosa]|uniref:hypothetical protein n=1 Tax=Pseudoalteromonas umbrosa TaxID=3048489 RepID=UPI0024C37B2D|nr:hypothetical protein [Pseudoalteromonas sp. B95]MDK1285743.1 hypothetical protein [Pseudoalteromonas sp. B95]